MFSSRQRLKNRTTPKDLNRFDYLQALVTEFQDTEDADARLQVLANLSNFAYDPINFEYLRKLQVPELFLDCIDDDEDLAGRTVQFGIAGICNLVSDPKNRDIVLAHDTGVQCIFRCLSSPEIETKLAAITTLIQLVIPASRDRIVTSHVLDCMRNFAHSSDSRLRNLAQVFIEDYG
uniref:Armadillo repeat-containing protein 7-like n=1 Tax=Ciona intestinalis TaxID=7719 RepID=F6ZJ92_CIOIN|nr:armadillo repeat-containing protein 7-like [Ciona intestinalis]|eukprot:XP_004226224.3 armadillo repeat-containing protein 7-like [Ciona intestinalis]